MARYARLEAPGAVHHLVSRFVNEEFRLIGARERRIYLERVPRALFRSDWRPAHFCLMSSHTHWGVFAGVMSSASFIKPLHVGVAGWLNRDQRRLGPVFAERHRSIICDPRHVARLTAYVHNNPVRAGIVRDPADSDWSSHRAYLGLVKPPEWLDVERGLAECGFDASASGRLAFHEYVVSRSGEPRSDELSGSGIAKQRARIRAIMGAAIECSWPVLERSRARSVVAIATHRARPPAWPGTAEEVLFTVAEQLQFDVACLLSRSRARQVSALRRLLLYLWTMHLGRSQVEMRVLLGLSPSGASNLLGSDRVDWDAVSRACASLETLIRPNK